GIRVIPRPLLGMLVLLGAALAASAVLVFTGGGTPSAPVAPSWPQSDTLVAHTTRASVSVRFRAGVSQTAQHRLLSRYGATEVSAVPELGLHVVTVAPDKALALLRSLRS